jgi:hypothetical protein
VQVDLQHPSQQPAVHQLLVALAAQVALVLLLALLHLQGQQQHQACLVLPPAAVPQRLVHRQPRLQPAAPLPLGALGRLAHQQQAPAQHLLSALVAVPHRPAQHPQQAQASTLLASQQVPLLRQQHLLQQLALALVLR